MATPTTIKGFIKDWAGNKILPITRGELVLDQEGKIALNSKYFLAGVNGSEYGLISAAERALLNGGIEGVGGIAELYEQLKLVNKGIQVNGTTLNFYDSKNNSTPINFIATPSAGITIGVSGNNLNLGLTELTTNETTVSNILKSITVDKYGRVTAVEGSELTTEDIPNLLVGKTLETGILKGCFTADEEIGTDAKAIVNKAYVDKKFNQVTGVATGALKFGGALSDSTVASNALSNSAYLNHYFKVTKEFVVNTGDLYDNTGISTTTITVKVGDTLIVYSEDNSPAKFVYIPSGDDITTITVTKDGEVNPTFAPRLGDVVLKFSDVFGITNPSGGNTAYITLPEVSASTNGYLSSADYETFKNYVNTLAVSYAGETTADTGSYKIGTLTIGGVAHELFGRNSVSTLELTDGATDAYNPILKFTETGATDVELTLKGVAGILVKRTGNSVEFIANNTVNTGSTDYLSITDGYKFGVKLGSLDPDTGEVTEGLVNFSTVHRLAAQVANTTIFEVIDYSLIGDDSTKKYQYGNENLVKAITVTI